MSTEAPPGLWYRAVQPRYAAWHVLVLLQSLLEGLTYGSYFIGLTVVNGDTNAHYLSDSYYWWNHGGILNPSGLGALHMDGAAGRQQPPGRLLRARPGHREPRLAVESHGSPPSPRDLYVLGAPSGMYFFLLLGRRLCGNYYWDCWLSSQLQAPKISNAQFLDFHRATVSLPWFLLHPVPAVVLGAPAGASPWPRCCSGRSSSAPIRGWLIGAAVCVLAWAFAWLFDRSHDKGWTWRAALAGCVAGALSAVKLVPALLARHRRTRGGRQRVLLSVPNLASVSSPTTTPP